MDRKPVGASFSTPVQTGTGSHPSSNTVGTGYFQGINRAGRDVDHRGRKSRDLYSLSEPSCSVLGKIYPIIYDIHNFIV